MAALINQQARRRGNPTPASAGPIPSDVHGGNDLIWVENDPGPAMGHGRSVVVVAHAPHRSAARRSLVISFPSDAAGGERRILAIADALAALGWKVLAMRRHRTALGHADIAVLASTARPGREQRLWLAEPPFAAPGHPNPCGPALPSGDSRAPSIGAPRRDGWVRAAREMRDRIEIWVNEGGAGGDAAG